jgi:hypothetical protein
LEYNTCVTAAFDREKISSIHAAHIVTVKGQSLGRNPAEIIVSSNSIRHSRLHHHKTIVKEIHASLGLEDQHKVHWDDRLLKAFTSKERYPAVKILVVPLLPNGTGEAQA